ncbi:MAG TPA: DUF1993 domain-containing protein [Burkholderiaceae bacterium]
MPLSMHSASAPVFVQMLSNMDAWLDKAQAYAEAKKFDTSVYLTLRLAPDMLPFVKQIQIASDNAKGCVARLAAVEIPKYEDNEASLAELKARIAKTIDFVKSVSVENFAGAETRAIELPQRNREPLRFDGETYLKHFALPNFFFHVNMTYALLRHAGVDLGKVDYLKRP